MYVLLTYHKFVLFVNIILVLFLYFYIYVYYIP